jgi:hypothetical protein
MDRNKGLAMKPRLLWVLALLVAVTGGGAHAADSGKKGAPSDTGKKTEKTEIGTKKLTIPSMELGGGSLGVSADDPNDPNVPSINDPQKQDKPVEPYFGLKFTKPLDGN